MIFTDTHAHLYSEEFNDDRTAVVQRAIDAGVPYMLLPGIDSSFVDGMLALCSQFPLNCFPMMGLHPTSVKESYQEELDNLYAQLQKHAGSIRAIGEIGIDLYWDKTYQAEQEEAFRIQLQWSKEYKLPVVIHTRNSFDLTVGILEEMKDPALKGVFHCFGGNIAQAERAIALGFKLGIGGVVTYKNSGLQQVVEATGVRHLLLETDAPYLTPAPHRGKRNESSYIPIIAQKIAEIKNLPVEEIAGITTENALSLFNISN